MSKLQQLAEQQLELAKQLQNPKADEGYIPQDTDLIFALDIQYVGEDAFVGIDVLQVNGKLLGTYVLKTQAGMEYVPQYFAFREGPPLLQAVQQLQAQTQLVPQLLIVDGHGIAHPRKLGVASWLGVQAGLPSIGLAKETLLRYSGELALARSSTLPIWLDNALVGVALRTQDGVKPVFVSTGHLISLAESVRLILALSEGGFRIPDPLRRADQAARAFAKGTLLGNAVELQLS